MMVYSVCSKLYCGKMAALRLKSVKNVTKCLLSGNFCTQIRQKSTKLLTTAVESLSTVEKVVTTSDGSTFVAWHPTHDFPYEFSKPLPPLNQIPASTLMKEESIQRAMEAFGSKHPEIARLELMKLTNTSKHTWKPRQRDRKAKKTQPDREYL
ncbi:39S ribosomal protein L42, mitochondrial [Contarinia nasturtii]|uniref:39S ribosomal protein L42, mitochondrial n=1 Tax=Contarinia nasturtii TaxID=265458 RepID=UPI0012D3E5E4|nr:39S ribosomal protein L42, mitochondrial [Contarinia nasturtii]